MIHTGKYMAVTDYYKNYNQTKKKDEVETKVKQDNSNAQKVSILEKNSSITQVEGATISISEEGKKIQEATTENEADMEETEDEKVSEEESETKKGRIGVNAGKLARKIAAAKTKSQLLAVMAEIKSDMQEVKAGVESGMCDQSEVEKVEILMAMAQNKMGHVEDREPTPEEENAFALASLM